MQICNLNQEQCERSIKIGSNELEKYDQCCR